MLAYACWGQFECWKISKCKYQAKSRAEILWGIQSLLQDLRQRVFILASFNFHTVTMHCIAMAFCWVKSAKSRQFHYFTMLAKFAEMFVKCIYLGKRDHLQKPNQGRSSGTGQKCHHGTLSYVESAHLKYL